MFRGGGTCEGKYERTQNRTKGHIATHKEINSQPWQRLQRWVYTDTHAIAGGGGITHPSKAARWQRRPAGRRGRAEVRDGKSLPFAVAMRTTSSFVPVHFIHPTASTTPSPLALQNSVRPPLVHHPRPLGWDDNEPRGSGTRRRRTCVSVINACAWCMYRRDNDATDF